MKLNDYITLLKKVDKIQQAHKLTYLQMNYDYETATASIFYENELGFTFAALEDAIDWLDNELLPYLTSRA